MHVQKELVPNASDPTVPSSVTTIVVVDDEELVREAFTSFFDREPRHELLGCATGGAEGVRMVDELQPDVVLMDLNMPRVSGIQATTQIMAHNPDACVVALTTFSDRNHVVGMLQAGAAGYLLKHADRESLLGAIAAARRGDMPLSPTVRRALVAAVQRDVTPATVRPMLAPRELELLGCLAEGLSNREIAQRMFLSEGSVKQYLSHIGDKLHRKSRTQILVRAIQLRLIDPNAPAGS